MPPVGEAGVSSSFSCLSSGKAGTSSPEALNTAGGGGGEGGRGGDTLRSDGFTASCCGVCTPGWGVSTSVTDKRGEVEDSKEGSGAKRPLLGSSFSSPSRRGGDSEDEERKERPENGLDFSKEGKEKEGN